MFYSLLSLGPRIDLEATPSCLTGIYNQDRQFSPSCPSSATHYCQLTFRVFAASKPRTHQDHTFWRSHSRESPESTGEGHEKDGSPAFLSFTPALLSSSLFLSFLCFFPSLQPLVDIKVIPFKTPTTEKSKNMTNHRDTQ